MSIPWKIFGKQDNENQEIERINNMSLIEEENCFFVYCKDANPNGDPLNANHPFDAETSQI